MELLLDPDQRLIQDSMVRLCAGLGGPARMRAMAGTQGQVDAQAMSQLQEAGWLKLLCPESAGGWGLGLFDLALVMEAAGQSLLHAPLAEVCASHWLLSQCQAPTSDDTLPCWIEPNDPYRRWTLWPQVRMENSVWRLSGKIQGPRFASHARQLIVPAQGPEGFLLCLVSADAAGLAWDRGVDVDDVSSAVLTLQGVAVDLTQILAHGQQAQTLYKQLGQILQIATSAALLGVSIKSHELTLEHLRTRRQFGRALASFQALQHRCVDAFVQLELNRSLVFRVAQAWDRHQHHPAMAHATKARTSKSALAITRLALQMHGAMGYTQAHDIGLYHRRALAWTASYGNDNHHAAAFAQQSGMVQGRAS